MELKFGNKTTETHQASVPIEDILTVISYPGTKPQMDLRHNCLYFIHAHTEPHNIKLAIAVSLN